MKHIVFFVNITAFALWLIPLNLKGIAPEIEAARIKGAKGQVTLRVIDSKGFPVEKASISVGFHIPSQKDNVIEGQTDTNGLFVVSGTCREDMHYTVTKDRYYQTGGDYWFYRRGEDCVQKGSWFQKSRWQPWNPTNTVVLKERRAPVPMHAKRIDAIIPSKDQPIDFDLEVGDWVVPHGKGKESDIYFTYRADLKDFWTGIKKLTIVFSNKVDGIYRANKDMWSEFNSAYEASSDGYQPSLELVLNATKDRVLEKEEIDRSECLIFRVRTVLDDKGNIVSARYGKIYGPIEYGGQDQHLRFTYYFNPTANDRNLEFDPSRNLFQWKHDARERPYMP